MIEEDVALKQQMCAQNLEKAEPALVAAQVALDTLNKVNLLYLKIINTYITDEYILNKMCILNIIILFTILIVSKLNTIAIIINYKLNINVLY